MMPIDTFSYRNTSKINTITALRRLSVKLIVEFKLHVLKFGLPTDKIELLQGTMVII